MFFSIPHRMRLDIPPEKVFPFGKTPGNQSPLRSFSFVIATGIPLVSHHQFQRHANFRQSPGEGKARVNFTNFVSPSGVRAVSSAILLRNPGPSTSPESGELLS
jgi:hypothetical protein